MALPAHPHSLPIEELYNELQSNPDSGLGDYEARKRILRYGANILQEEKPDSPVVVLLRQFESPLIYILAIAGFVTALTADFTDSFAIWIVLIFNAVIGFYQERRAEQTIQALKRFLTSSAKVVRDSTEHVIPAQELVPGDLVLLTAGDRVPADARLIEASGLAVSEAMLTGESLPSDKAPGEVSAEATLADRENTVYMGTLVVAGAGKAIVVATGLQTEVGKIARLIQTTAEVKTPLQRTLEHFGHRLAGITISATAALMLIGLASGRSFGEMLGTAISLTVSAIPEGLPVVVTVTLGVGMWRMAQKQAVIRRLPAVETLGEVTVVCTDKTGTLTRGEMMIEKIVLGQSTYRVEGSGYLPEGKFYDGEHHLTELPNDLKLIGQAAGIVSNAHLNFSPDRQNVQELIGDPTEAAVLTLAHRLGFDHPKDKKVILPFDDRRRYSIGGGNLGELASSIYLGAPETILGASSKYLTTTGHEELTQAVIGHLEAQQKELTSAGYRVVSMAYNGGSADPKAQARDLTFIGLLAMMDPLRPEAKEAIGRVRAGGVRVIMLTGDHLLTAQSIAGQVGLLDGEVVEAEKLAKLSPEDFDRAVLSVAAIARATPEEKLKVVESLKRQGQIVAMTGDGVNDAPALKTADIGIAMGRAGTDVAVEASDMVLLDDNFSHIVNAIEEGRVIWNNLRKVIFYLLSTSLGEIMTILAALLLGLPLPVIAAQIIWLNLVTDGVSTIPLSLESQHGDILSRRPPRRPKEPIVDQLMVARMLIIGLIMMTGTMILFSANLHRGIEVAQTSALLVLAAFQWFNVLNARSENKSIFEIGIFSNRYVVFSTLGAIALQLGATYLPFMQAILKTAPLEIGDWLAALGIAATIVVVEELRKLLFRNTKNVTLAIQIPTRLR